MSWYYLLRLQFSLNLPYGRFLAANFFTPANFCLLPIPFLFGRWKNHYDIEITDQERIKAADGVLSIQNAQESDTGNYSCHTENIAGVRERTIELIVSG